MTLRQLWLMTTGKLEYSRAMMLSHSIAIGKRIAQMFGDSTPFDHEHFVKYGGLTSVVEELTAETHEKVARFMREGKVTFDG